MFKKLEQEWNLEGDEYESQILRAYKKGDLLNILLKIIDVGSQYWNRVNFENAFYILKKIIRRNIQGQG